MRAVKAPLSRSFTPRPTAPVAKVTQRRTSVCLTCCISFSSALGWGCFERMSASDSPSLECISATWLEMSNSGWVGDAVGVIFTKRDIPEMPIASNALLLRVTVESSANGQQLCCRAGLGRVNCFGGQLIRLARSTVRSPRKLNHGLTL